MSPRSPRRASAFTLVEILVVIAIIGLLAALAIPAVSSVQKKSAETKALHNNKQLFLAALQFSQDNNGEILGWGTGNNWSHDLFLMRNLNRYLTGQNITATDPASLTKIGEGLAPFVDPAVPIESNKYTQYFPYTFSINAIFNRIHGRWYQSKSNSWIGTTRRTSEFDKPSSLIYAVSGGYQFTSASGSDPALLTWNPPAARPSIFFLYGGKKSTPAVFLDGHVEMLRFPIAESMILPATN